MSDLAIQMIGFVGAAIFALSYQIKASRGLLLYQLVGCIVFALQFLLIGAFTGAISLTINVIRNLLLYESKDWKWVRCKGTLSIIIVLMSAMTVYTWSGWRSLLPFAATVVTSIGYWTTNAQKIRSSQLFSAPCQLLYDALVHSWGGVLNETVTLISIIISIIRFGWKELAANEDEFSQGRSR